MKNSLMILTITGLAALATTGCDRVISTEIFSGRFRSADAIVVRDMMGILSGIQLKQDGFGTKHHLLGISIGSDTSFNEIMLDGKNIRYWNRDALQSFPGYPLGRYANKRSLMAAYNAVLEQNKASGGNR